MSYGPKRYRPVPPGSASALRGRLRRVPPQPAQLLADPQPLHRDRYFHAATGEVPGKELTIPLASQEHHPRQVRDRLGELSGYPLAPREAVGCPHLVERPLVGRDHLTRRDQAMLGGQDEPRALRRLGEPAGLAEQVGDVQVSGDACLFPLLADARHKVDGGAILLHDDL